MALGLAGRKLMLFTKQLDCTQVGLVVGLAVTVAGYVAAKQTEALPRVALDAGPGGVVGFQQKMGRSRIGSGRARRAGSVSRVGRPNAAAGEPRP
jgi:hypothetical protein